MEATTNNRKQVHPDYGIMLIPLIIIGIIAATFFI